MYIEKHLPGNHYDIVICNRGTKATTGQRKTITFRGDYRKAG